MVDQARICICRTANILPVFDDEPWDEKYLSLGLRFFHTIIKGSHEDQLDMMYNYSGISNPSLSEALEEEAPEWDNPMYDAWLNQDFQGFSGDDDRDSPNAAWVWSTKNKVEIRYYQSDKEALRKWGYVMWDKVRLDQWNFLQENPDDYLMK